MEIENTIHQQIYSLFGRWEFRKGNEMNCFGKLVNYGENGKVAVRGWKSRAMCDQGW